MKEPEPVMPPNEIVADTTGTEALLFLPLLVAILVLLWIL